jgi:hypothetical protein
VPAAADGYTIAASDALKPFLGGADDPAIKELREFAFAEKWPQSRMDDTLKLMQHFADKGLLGDSFDPAAEIAALGENGKAQMEEQETFINAAVANGKITEAEAEELLTLSVTANGTRALAALRKMMGEAGLVVAPAGGGVDHAANLNRAKEMRRDPQYDSDPKFRKEADALFMASAGKR